MLTPEHPLSILILGLRTDLTDKQLAELGAVMGTEVCPWETLLSLANLHRVTLLWYLRLQQHDLAQHMPEDLRHYLDALLEQNRTRNGNLMAASDRCLEAFYRDGLEVILLKGAAALADDLYHDVGARLMGDIDLLIWPEQLEQVEQALSGLGFQVADEDRDNQFYSEHHHLPPYHHPDWQVCLELHLDTADFKQRNAFPPERLFSRAETVLVGEWPVKILHSSDRLLHNACHSIVQDAGWLYSWCSLHEWAEWDLLLRRAESSVDFAGLLAHAGQGGFTVQLKVYALLANRLFGSPVPAEWHDRRETRHVNRLLAGLAWRGNSAREPSVVRRHYLWQVLPHSWHSHHFSRQQVPLLQRVTHFIKLALRPSSWERLRLK
jgi:hypothetical protein